MHFIIRMSIVILFMAFFQSAVAQLAFPNNFTVQKKVPHGCLFVLPSLLAAPPEDVFVDSVLELTDVAGVQANLRIRIWRIGCHEPNRSAIAINFSLASGSPNALGLPLVSLDPGGLTGQAPAYLSLFSANNAEVAFFSFPWIFPLSEQEFFVDGSTYIIDSADPDLTTDAYNDTINLELSWGTEEQTFDVDIFEYAPALDATQLPTSPFNGRYSGQWNVDGLPRSGLVLQIGEVAPDRNFIFAIWFTYVQGDPTWFVANADFAIGDSEVVLDMVELSGGEVVTQPNSFTADDVTVESVGTMTLRTIHCNALEADIDFRQGGFGQQVLELNRLIRIAGYDCDQTQ